MDKIVLQHEDLAKLVTYIRSRGFHDAAVVAEILDHFACKVEEHLNADPQLSLEAAMEKAHDGFGTLGFRPLVVAYEVQVKRKYKAIYCEEWRRSLQNVPLTLTSLLAGAAVCKSFTWVETHAWHHFLGINDVIWILITGVMTAGAVMLRKLYNRSFFASVLAAASRNEYNTMLSICIAFIVPARELHSGWQVNLFALLYTLATIYCILDFSARYRTVRRALAEFKTMEQSVNI